MDYEKEHKFAWEFAEYYECVNCGLTITQKELNEYKDGYWNENLKCKKKEIKK